MNNKTLVILVLGISLLSGCAKTQSREVHVSANATVEAKPELVVFEFLIEERGKLLKPLKTSVDRKASALVKLCKKLGIEPRDLTSAELSIEPQYHYNTNRFTGYHVSRTVTARLYDLEKYSKVINGAVSSGITTVRNISLQLKDSDELENRALTKAVDKGTAKAQLLAKQTGVKLGKVLSVVETGADNYYAANYLVKQKRSRGLTDVASEAAPFAFEPGQLSVSKTVQLSFAID